MLAYSLKWWQPDKKDWEAKPWKLVSDTSGKFDAFLQEQ